MSDAPNKVETVLCVPGMWKDRAELVTQIAKLSGGYIFAGQILLHNETQASFELEVHGHDTRMANSFRAAGPHWATTPEMERIGGHTMVTYLIGKGGTSKDAENMMLAATGLLYSGGLGVKVETSGIAHNPTDWIHMTDYRHCYTPHGAFVMYAYGDETYSCGMHNLGYRDAIIQSTVTEHDVELIKQFTQYVFRESPVIREGQTFGVETGSPRYRITEEKCMQYGEGHLFTNPFGMWRLNPVARE